MASTPGPVAMEYDEDGANGSDGTASLWFGPPAVDTTKRIQYAPEHCIEWEYGLYRFDEDGERGEPQEVKQAEEALDNLRRIEALWNAAVGLSDEQVLAMAAGSLIATTFQKGE